MWINKELSEAVFERVKRESKTSRGNDNIFTKYIETGMLQGFISTLPDTPENRQHFKNFIAPRFSG